MFRSSDAVISTVEVPTTPIETTGEYSRTPKTFQPEYWLVDFGYFNRKPTYSLIGPRLTKSSQPYGDGQEVGMKVDVSEVPAATRLNLVEHLRTKLRQHVAEEEAKIALVAKGVTK
jgi:hypothetical protein